MTNRVVAMLGSVLLAFGLWSPADAASNLCPDTGGTEYLVDTPADADDIAGGYTNLQCDLKITVNVTPTLADWKVFARSFTIVGSKVPANPFVVPPPANSSIYITVTGDIECSNSELRARQDLIFRTTAVDGKYSAVGCKTIASSTLDPFAIPGNKLSGPATGGQLTIQAFGGISQVASDTYAGVRIHFISNADITFLCQAPPAQRSACEDPSLICPGGFPCLRDFTSAAEFRSVACQSAPQGDAPVCEGGANEVNLTAEGNINLTLSVFPKFLSHLMVLSGKGNINASGVFATVKTSMFLQAKGIIDATGAIFDVGRTLRLTTGLGCLAPAECIDASLSSMTATDNILFATNQSAGGINLCGGAFNRIANGFPTFNSDSVPPYPVSVKEDAAECAPLLPAVIQ